MYGEKCSGGWKGGREKWTGGVRKGVEDVDGCGWVDVPDKKKKRNNN